MWPVWKWHRYIPGVYRISNMSCNSCIIIHGDPWSSTTSLLSFSGCSPLTKSRFVTAVRNALTQMGLGQSLYAGHSFRIGPGTAAAQAGVEDSTIKALARWSSTAFLIYIQDRHSEHSSLILVGFSNIALTILICLHKY